MENKYPFEFKELLLTDKVLDKLGFSEYWAGSGDFGNRNLDLNGIVGDEQLINKKEYPRYNIKEIDDNEDPESGYGVPEYCSNHFCNKDFSPIYFLHEMYEDIVKRRTPEELEKFIEITKQKGVNMYPYIKSYIKYKNEKQKMENKEYIIDNEKYIITSIKTSMFNNEKIYCLFCPEKGYKMCIKESKLNHLIK